MTVEPEKEQADKPTEPRHSIATWLRVDRDVVEGLHILRMSADPSWIVRKDLYIKLESLVHAQMLFSVDLDLGKIRAGLPDVLATEARPAETHGHGRPVWLPILRQPATLAVSQRVSSAIDGNNQAVPIMRSSDVRYRLSTALAWLFLSGYFQPRGHKPLLGEISRLQLLVQVALEDYLVTGSDEALEQALADDPTAPPLARQAIDQLKKLATDPLVQTEADQGQETTYEDAFRHCLTYARTGRFVVVGLTPGNSRHVECHLLPTELTVSTTEAPRSPATALGFELVAGRYVDYSSESAPKRVGQRFRELTRRWHRPAAYHFQFPVPEVSLLDGSTSPTSIPPRPGRSRCETGTADRWSMQFCGHHKQEPPAMREWRP